MVIKIVITVNYEEMSTSYHMDQFASNKIFRPVVCIYFIIIVSIANIFTILKKGLKDEIWQT